MPIADIKISKEGVELRVEGLLAAREGFVLYRGVRRLISLRENLMASFKALPQLSNGVPEENSEDI